MVGDIVPKLDKTQINSKICSKLKFSVRYPLSIEPAASKAHLWKFMLHVEMWKIDGSIKGTFYQAKKELKRKGTDYVQNKKTKLSKEVQLYIGTEVTFVITVSNCRLAVTSTGEQEDGYRELRGVFFWTKGNSIKAHLCPPDESLSPGDLLHGV